MLRFLLSVALAAGLMYYGTLDQLPPTGTMKWLVFAALANAAYQFFRMWHAVIFEDDLDDRRQKQEWVREHEKKNGEGLQNGRL